MIVKEASYSSICYLLNRESHTRKESHIDKMKHIIITGASRGFGQSIAEAFAGADTTLHLIARSNCDQTTDLVKRHSEKCIVQQYHCDLTDNAQLNRLTDQLGTKIPANSDRVILINNAGTLHPIGPAGKYAQEDYRANLALNYVAPLMLSHWFLSTYKESNKPHLIVCVSSGAAQHPYYGWSHYCSTKAGVDMFVKTVALEQSTMDHPIEIIGFNPSRIETDMQKEIRSQDPGDFEQVEDFRASAEDGRNNPPAKLARALQKVVDEKQYQSGEIVRGKDHI
ncbi:MAG: SDR family NAD(P)-dependent oxidoreductase [Bacteroidota bacterium]